MSRQKTDKGTKRTETGPISDVSGADTRRSNLFRRAATFALISTATTFGSGCPDWSIPENLCVHQVENSTNSKAAAINELLTAMGYDLPSGLYEDECNAWHAYTEDFIVRLRDLAVLLQDLGASTEDITQAVLFIRNPGITEPGINDISIPLTRSLSEEEQELLNTLVGDGEYIEIRHGNVNYTLYWDFDTNFFTLNIGCSAASVSDWDRSPE